MVSSSVNPTLSKRTRKIIIPKSPLLEEERNFETTTTSPFTLDMLELPELTLLYPFPSYFLFRGDYFESPKLKITTSDSAHSSNKSSSHSRD
ncbi:10386_t:CDS:2 [Diversispora eburnea]|uniref:10386_t:CDS:1 n=1 Tax=Diversispora eburnea TaxID=1213867 RepID=A0A9N9GFB5_9GLOM|nr:10386_t:CDS:2 [Diversispora eburnea]